MSAYVGRVYPVIADPNYFPSELTKAGLLKHKPDELYFFSLTNSNPGV
jgi:hypothetical protein